METLREEPTQAAAQAKGPAAVKQIPQAESSPPRSMPWLVAGLMVMTAAFLVLAILTIVPRLRPSAPVRLMDQAVATWDSGTPSEFAATYARDAVVVHADGTKVTGLQGIIADAKAAGPDFTMVRTGDVSVTHSGSYVAAVYRYTGAGRGSGLLVLQIADGKITQQWSYDLP
jgi:hypothetical protein